MSCANCDANDHIYSECPWLQDARGHVNLHEKCTTLYCNVDSKTCDKKKKSFKACEVCFHVGSHNSYCKFYGKYALVYAT